jgi:cyclophilin family peptidyl-prolyl cis-trans isomerase
VKAGHYNGTIFHRVIPNFMIQGGGFDAQMTEKQARPPIKNESANGLLNKRGTLAMARTNDINSATAQFFINTKDNDFLDPAHPESLVYNVDGDKRTLAGAMYIASARPTDDPSLLSFAGPLMQWHNHGNLCWSVEADGKPRVVGITDANGNYSFKNLASGSYFISIVQKPDWTVTHPTGGAKRSSWLTFRRRLLLVRLLLRGAAGTARLARRRMHRRRREGLSRSAGAARCGAASAGAGVRR